MDYISVYDSPIGKIVLSSDGKCLTGLWFENQKYFGSTLIGEQKEEELEIFIETKRWLDIYFSGKEPDFYPCLKLKGTQFRNQVWSILQQIPYGEVITYGDISKILGKRMSAQAVGQAVGHNPISILVPCHRVVGQNKKVTGYAGGIDKKLYLLKLEGLDIHTFRL